MNFLLTSHYSTRLPNRHQMVQMETEVIAPGMHAMATRRENMAARDGRQQDWTSGQTSRESGRPPEDSECRGQCHSIDCCEISTCCWSAQGLGLTCSLTRHNALPAWTRPTNSSQILHVSASQSSVHTAARLAARRLSNSFSSSIFLTPLGRACLPPEYRTPCRSQML
jgi:hypothetical protein